MKKPCPTAAACVHCVEFLQEGRIHRQAVQPLRGGALDSLALDRRPQCQDCAFADTLTRLTKTMDRDMARTAVANFRMESMRLPDAPIGLALNGARISKHGEFEEHLLWLDKVLPPDEENP